jgi:hypothetical protein
MQRSVPPDRRPNSRVRDNMGQSTNSGRVATPICFRRGSKWDEIQMKASLQKNLHTESPAWSFVSVVADSVPPCGRAPPHRR